MRAMSDDANSGNRIRTLYSAMFSYFAEKLPLKELSLFPSRRCLILGSLVSLHRIFNTKVCTYKTKKNTLKLLSSYFCVLSLASCSQLFCQHIAYKLDVLFELMEHNMCSVHL